VRVKPKLLPIVGAMALLLGASATPVAAMTGPILPGRPIFVNGQSCRGTAYGRVNGAFVLFLANHCYDSLATGAPIYDTSTNPDTFIGYLGQRSSLWNGNDLTYIRLDSTRIPASGRNRIYKGDMTGNGLTSDDYFYVTRNPSTPCSSLPPGGNWLDDIYHPFQATQATTTKYRTGQLFGKMSNGGPDGCLILTLLSVHSACCDSGSPLIGSWATNTVLGIATDREPSNNTIRFNSLYEGLEDLNDYMVDHGGSGAWLCQTSAC